jgi:ACS family hexuronate transporter-like MFS transporter
MPDPAPSTSHQRWSICALLFFAATINYMDRQVIALLKPTLQSQLGWSEIGYSNIVFAFHVAYAIGLLVMGRVVDRLGTRRGFSLSVLVWSAAAMAHAVTRSVLQFSIVRFALGIGESGNFPSSIKTVAEWFPKKERALATGLFNSGTNIGAIVTPLVVPWITYRFGWQMAFIGTGALGLIWLLAWWTLYQRPEKHPGISPEELAYIRSDPPEVDPPKISLRTLIDHRQTWAIALGRLFTDPIWYVYLFWIPDFLSRRFGLSLQAMAVPLFVIYSGATVGSISGGWISSTLLKHGVSLNRSRKTALLACALAVTPVIFASSTSHIWLAVAVVAVAAGAHQGWSANMYTLASDIFPRAAVGSVVGFGSMAGAIGALFAAKAVGYILQFTGSYVLVFLIAGLAYLFAFFLMQLLAPRIAPITLEGTQP